MIIPYPIEIDRVVCHLVRQGLSTNVGSYYQFFYENMWKPSYRASELVLTVYLFMGLGNLSS